MKKLILMNICCIFFQVFPLNESLNALMYKRLTEQDRRCRDTFALLSASAACSLLVAFAVGRTAFIRQGISIFTKK